MAVIANITLESGQLLISNGGDFDTVSGADLSIDASAALAGTGLGLKIVLDDTTADRGRKNLSDASGIARLRFYFDPNSFTGDNYSQLELVVLMNGSGNEFASIRCQLAAVGHYHIFCRANNDAPGTNDSADYDIANCPHYFELLTTKSSGANDGVQTLWIDGVQVYTKTDIDNDTIFDTFLYVLFGNNLTTPANPGGSIYLDQLVVRNDNVEIGPYYNSANGAAVYGYNGAELDDDDSPIPWPIWDDGAAGSVTVSGDANWGKLQLIAGAEGRGKVIDFGDANPRTYTITENAFTGSAGQGDADLQIRGDANPFNQDDALPAWTTYTVPTLQSWRYVQVRESRE